MTRPETSGPPRGPEAGHTRAERDVSNVGTVTLGAAVPLVLLVLAVGSAVAVAAEGLRLLAPAATLGTGASVAIRVAGVVAVVAGAAGLLVQRQRLTVAGSNSDPSGVALRTAAMIMGVLALVALLDPPPPDPDEEVDDPARGGWAGAPWGTPERSATGTPRPQGARGGESAIHGSGAIIEAPGLDLALASEEESPLMRAAKGTLPWLMFLLLVALLMRALKRKRSAGAGEEEGSGRFELRPAQAAVGLEAGLDAFDLEGLDPRDRIANAYRRLLDALTRAGAPRGAHEGPHEHLFRALGPLGVRPEPLHELAGLYVLARYSTRTVTETHRNAAVRALETGLADLRGASHPRPHGSAGRKGSGGAGIQADGDGGSRRGDPRGPGTR